MMYPMVTFVMFEEVIKSGKIGPGSAASVVVFLYFRPILINGKRPDQRYQPVDQQQIQRFINGEETY